MHLHVRRQRTRHWHLLPGELHQILDIQLRGVEIDLQGTLLREGPFVQTGAGVEGDLSMRGGFQIGVLQAGQRWIHIHIGSQHTPLGSVDFELRGGQLPGQMRGAGRSAHRALKERRAGKPQRLSRCAEEIRDRLQLGKVVGLKFHTQARPLAHDAIHG